MKLKSAITRTAPPSLIADLNGPLVADKFRELGMTHLHIKEEDWGPASHFVQETDLTIEDSSGNIGLNVALTQISANRFRSAQDFADMYYALQGFFGGLIEKHVLIGNRIHLYVVITVDKPIEGLDGKLARLVEENGKWVSGTKIFFNTNPVDDRIV